MSSCSCHKCSCHDHDHDNHKHHHDHHHDHSKSKGNIIKNFIPEILSGILLVISLIIPWQSTPVEIFAYIVTCLPVGLPILISTFKEWARGDVFNEFTLMVMACVGAFIIGEYPEGVAVLLFYSFGEKLEDVVSGDVKGQIKSLLGKMPRNAVVLKDGERLKVKPEEVKPGMIIVVKPGESIPLDGVLLNESADFNTSAITGESLPRLISEGGSVNSGIIPIDKEVTVEVTKEYNDSSMSRIMGMIEDAAAHRAPSEKILRKITKWYTPLVFSAAVLLFLIPCFIGWINPDFHFIWHEWLERSLVFLVCSCPCALIVSIPLSYFASIGIASKKGILFKGHDSLDALRNVDVVMFDKTGTVTTGNFHVSKIVSLSGNDDRSILAYTSALEVSSKHPLAEAVVEESKKRKITLPQAQNIKTRNHGLTGEIDGREVVIGSGHIMDIFKIDHPETSEGTIIYVAVDKKLIGYIVLEDTIKDGVGETVESLHRRGVREVGILSGDAVSAVNKVSDSIKADIAKGELLPEDKLNIINERKKSGYTVAFVGDGINDSPSLASSDVGIAMGKLGTDMAIESAQVVIAGDDLRKIVEGLDISRKVKSVIIENVSFAFGIKLLVMILGAFGIASLWAAVFADTGVTLITVLWTLYRLKIWQLKEKPLKTT